MQSNVTQPDFMIAVAEVLKGFNMNKYVGAKVVEATADFETKRHNLDIVEEHSLIEEFGNYIYMIMSNTNKFALGEVI